MINPNLHTACKTCIFAIFKDITQTDCKLDLINKFRQHNKEILEVYDEEKEFYVINNTKCIHMRPKEWKYADEQFDKKIEYLNNEINRHFHAIIFVKTTLEDCQKTLNSLLEQKLKPKHITFIRPIDSDVKPSELVNICKNLTIKWKVENLINVYDNIQNSLNILMPFIKCNIYIIFNSGFIVPPETLFDINNAIINDFLQFMLLLPNKDGNGFVGLRILHEHYKNFSKPLEQMLIADGCPKTYLIPITKLLPYFPK
jgi:hypothetical protein